MRMDRREFCSRVSSASAGSVLGGIVSSGIGLGGALLGSGWCDGGASGQPVDAAELASDRVAAMLLGSLIGDALGGPVEFLPSEQVVNGMPAFRSWPDDRDILPLEIRQLGESLTMYSYDPLRPETAAYGPWSERAPAGTITDDSRHKIVLMRAIRDMLTGNRPRLSTEDLARAYLDFTPHEKVAVKGNLARLLDEGFREYRMASRWLLGDRQPQRALPVERLWGGVSNCSGQMALLPLAAVFPGQPERAYRETFRIDFIDAPIARDIVSAINAGLSAVLGSDAAGKSDSERWDLLIRTMRRTDPYRFAEVPFAGRQLDRWLDLVDSIVERSQGSPKVAYRLLETEGKPVYFWDAHFTLLVPLTLLKLCRYDPLAALQMTLDFGHDTDSYAQILGAMAGAVHGDRLWQPALSEPVRRRLHADYGESIDDWQRLLTRARDRWVDPPQASVK